MVSNPEDLGKEAALLGFYGRSHVSLRRRAFQRIENLGQREGRSKAQKLKRSKAGGDDDKVPPPLERRMDVDGKG